MLPQVRVEQVLMMAPPLLLCYQLGQLTAFYHALLADILGPGAALSRTVDGCRELAHRCGAGGRVAVQQVGHIRELAHRRTLQLRVPKQMDCGAQVRCRGMQLHSRWCTWGACACSLKAVHRTGTCVYAEADALGRMCEAEAGDVMLRVTGHWLLRQPRQRRLY
eukprot:GHRQ01031948.1.p3 GENE.GHRQ01031948.1~~GHRQ01031948.1.p3  ORF type:complete len:164 (-),score=58.57 GHRQ01031948.1:313-804(-)